jgi:hypothetical protein
MAREALAKRQKDGHYDAKIRFPLLPLPVLMSSECCFVGSHPNCTDDLPPGSFVTLEVVLLPSMKTFWFSFIPYDIVSKQKWRMRTGTTYEAQGRRELVESCRSERK